MYISGEWITSPQMFPVFNPATGEQIGAVVDGGREDASRGHSHRPAALPEAGRRSPRTSVHRDLPPPTSG